MFPGDGFISNPECTALARAEYACIEVEEALGEFIGLRSD